MNRFNEEKYDTIAELEKCENHDCEEKAEWNYTFTYKGTKRTAKLCSDCVENLIDNVACRYHQLDRIEEVPTITVDKAKVKTLKREK